MFLASETGRTVCLQIQEGVPGIRKAKEDPDQNEIQNKSKPCIASFGEHRACFIVTVQSTLPTVRKAGSQFKSKGRAHIALGGGSLSPAECLQAPATGQAPFIPGRIQICQMLHRYMPAREFLRRFSRSRKSLFLIHAKNPSFLILSSFCCRTWRATS